MPLEDDRGKDELSFQRVIACDFGVGVGVRLG